MLNQVFRSTIRYALLGTLLLTGLKHAEALPVCQTASLASYIALDTAGGCTFDDLTFFRFSFSPAPIGTGGAALATAADITVTPVFNPTVGYGFSYTSSFFTISSNLGTVATTYNIGYSVDPPPIIESEGLFLDPPFGNVLVTQSLCLNDVLANSCRYGVSESQAVTPSSPLSYVIFPYSVPFVDVLTTVTLTATPGNPAGFDAIQTGSLLSLPPTNPVPEPGTAALTVVSLATAVGGLQLRKRRKA